MKKLAITAFTFLALSACGKEKTDEVFKYSLTENGCATGEITASSKEEMCNLLKNDEANKYCAGSLRRQKFQQDGCGTW
jgi:hypothetical protein